MCSNLFSYDENARVVHHGVVVQLRQTQRQRAVVSRRKREAGQSWFRSVHLESAEHGRRVTLSRATESRVQAPPRGEGLDWAARSPWSNGGVMEGGGAARAIQGRSGGHPGTWGGGLQNDSNIMCSSLFECLRDRQRGRHCSRIALLATNDSHNSYWQ